MSETRNHNGRPEPLKQAVLPQFADESLNMHENVGKKRRSYNKKIDKTLSTEKEMSLPFATKTSSAESQNPKQALFEEECQIKYKTRRERDSIVDNVAEDICRETKKEITQKLGFIFDELSKANDPDFFNNPHQKIKDQYEQQMPPGEKSCLIENRKKIILKRVADKIDCKEKEAIMYALDLIFCKLRDSNDEGFIENPHAAMREFWDIKKWIMLKLNSTLRAKLLLKPWELIQWGNRQGVLDKLRNKLNQCIEEEDEKCLSDPSEYFLGYWERNKWEFIESDKRYLGKILELTKDKIAWTDAKYVYGILQKGLNKCLKEKDEIFLTNPVGYLLQYWTEKRKKDHYYKYDFE